MAGVRVLVVDDEPDIRRLMSHALTAHGMIVDTAPDGVLALKQLQRQTYDVMLLDVLMPGTSGLELLPSVFQLCPKQRVMMVSALNEPRTRIRCLELGAVDYVSKPFALAELVARVRIHTRVDPGGSGPVRVERRVGERRVHDRRVLQRRHGGGEPPLQADDRFIRTPEATLDLRGRRVHVGGQVAELSERESLVLAHLMGRPGQVCTRQEILDSVWGAGSAQGSNVVDVYVGRVRGKLPIDLISTVRNSGYVFGVS